MPTARAPPCMVGWPACRQVLGDAGSGAKLEHLKLDVASVAAVLRHRQAAAADEARAEAEAVAKAAAAERQARAAKSADDKGDKALAAARREAEDERKLLQAKVLYVSYCMCHTHALARQRYIFCMCHTHALARSPARRRLGRVGGGGGFRDGGAVGVRGELPICSAGVGLGVCLWLQTGCESVLAHAGQEPYVGGTIGRCMHEVGEQAVHA